MGSGVNIAFSTQIGILVFASGKRNQNGNSNESVSGFSGPLRGPGARRSRSSLAVASQAGIPPLRLSNHVSVPLACAGSLARMVLSFDSFPLDFSSLLTIFFQPRWSDATEREIFEWGSRGAPYQAMAGSASPRVDVFGKFTALL